MPVLNVDGLGVEGLVNPCNCHGCGRRAEYWVYELLDKFDSGFYLCGDCLPADLANEVKKYQEE